MHASSVGGSRVRATMTTKTQHNKLNDKTNICIRWRSEIVRCSKEMSDCRPGKPVYQNWFVVSSGYGKHFPLSFSLLPHSTTGRLFISQILFLRETQINFAIITLATHASRLPFCKHNKKSPQQKCHPKHAATCNTLIFAVKHGLKTSPLFLFCFLGLVPIEHFFVKSSELFRTFALFTLHIAHSLPIPKDRYYPCSVAHSCSMFMGLLWVSDRIGLHCLLHSILSCELMVARGWGMLVSVMFVFVYMQYSPMRRCHNL